MSEIENQTTDVNYQAAAEKILLENVREQKKSRKWNVFFKFLTFAYLTFIIYSFSGLTSFSTIDEPHIGIVNLNGQIAYGSEWSSAYINQGLKNALDDPNSVAVILSINSPGGSPVQSDEVYQFLMQARETYEKPIYAVINDLGASGGYYIASGASEIYANKMSLIGSIGVISGSFGFTEAMEKLGIERRIYTAGENKSMLDPFSPEDPEQLKKWQEVLSLTHNEFISSVKNGRGDRLSNDKDLFSGRIWSGTQALDLGLIDGFHGVKSLAMDKYNIDVFKNYTVKSKSLSNSLEKFGVKIGEGIANKVFSHPNIQ